MTCHLVEKASQWEYINLTYLLKDHNSHDQLIAVIGHVLSVTDQEPHSSTRVSNDISPGLHHLYSYPSSSKRNYPRRVLAAHSTWSFKYPMTCKVLNGHNMTKTFMNKGLQKWGELIFQPSVVTWLWSILILILMCTTRGVGSPAVIPPVVLPADANSVPELTKH